MHRAAPLFVGCALHLVLSIVPASGQTCTPQWWNASEGLEPQIYSILVPHTLAEFDADGLGPRSRHLYTAGFFTFNDGMMLTPGIARWDGFEWTSVAQGLGAGGINVVLSLAAYDADGGGPGLGVLVAGGIFGNAGGVPVKNIAQWNGTAWSAMGSGFPPAQLVRSVASHDPDGNGPALPYLVAAGTFQTLGDGTTPCRSVARWNGSTWSSSMQLQPTNVGQCVCVKSFDTDGPAGLPPVLIAWLSSNASWPYGIFRWNGTQWGYTGLTLEGTEGITYDTATPGAVWDSDGTGPDANTFYLGSPGGLYRWAGGGWFAVPNSAGGGSMLAVVDEDGPGPLPSRLFSATADNRIVRWDGVSWTTVGQSQTSTGVTADPYCMIGYDNDGAGPQPGSLYVGGDIRSISGVPVHGLARRGCEEGLGSCVGDVNHDASINFNDITDVLTNWGAVGTVASPAFGDANQDNSVGFTDITAVLTSWGQDCTGSRPTAFFSVAPIIEPDADSPMGRLLAVQRQEGHAGVMRMLAEWPGKTRSESKSDHGMFK